VDSRAYKWNSDTTLKKTELSIMPEYLRKNKEKYSKWLEV
jgi:hypothetical protein